MTWTLVQKSASVAAVGTGTTITVTLPGNSTAGNLLEICLLNASGTATWSLPAGWVRGPNVQNSGITHAEIWYYPNNPGGISSVICTSSASTNLKGAGAEHHTDVTSPTVTLNATGTVIGGTVAQVTATTGTAAAAGDLAVCCFHEHFTTPSAVTWTDPAGFTLIGSTTTSGGNQLYAAYDLSVPSGALSVTGKTNVASDQAHGWSGVVATFTASPPAAGTPGLVGAYLNPSAIGASTQAQANSLWQTITARSLDVRRVYFTTGQIPAGITADLTADAAAGRKAAISMRPAFNPPTTADLDALNTFLASCKGAGLIADVSLWQEPYGSGLPGHVSAGLTQALFISGWQFYAPTIRQYYPMVFDTSSYSVVHNNENAYYPGDAWVDKVATDFYCSEYDGGIRLDQMAALADGATPPKPFGLWEFNSSTDPSQGQTQAQSTAYFAYLQSFFTARLTAGKVNADLLLFNSNTLLTQETAITSAADYRVALYQSLYDALSAGGSNPVNLASQIDINVNMAESLTAVPVSVPGTPAAASGIGWPQLILEVGVIPETPVATPGSFILGDPVWGRLGYGKLGGGTIWTDITAYARTISVSRPSTRQQGPLITYQPGTLAVTLDNSDGRFDPDNPAGPYVIGGVNAIHAMTPVRLRAVTGNTGYFLFHGFADGWQPAAQAYEGGYGEVNLNATDGFKVLQGITLAPLATAAGTGEDTGARIRRILDAAAWYTGKRQIATGDTQLQGTTFGDTALNLMQLAADSEIGELYIDGSGTLVFRHRQAILTDTRSAVPQAAFGDADGTVHGALTELAYASVSRASDDTTLANDVQITRAGGILQESTNPASIAMYLFPRTYSRTDVLLLSDIEAKSYAQWVRYVSQATETRFETLAVDPLADTVNLFPQVLGRDIGDRITVYNRPAGLTTTAALGTPYLIGSTATASATTTPTVQAVTTPTAAGDAIAVIAGGPGSGLVAAINVSDSQGNSYVKQAEITVSGTLLPTSVWTATGATRPLTVSDTITVTWSSAAGMAKTIVAIGCPGAGAADQAAAVSGFGTAVTVSTGPLAQAGEMAVLAVNDGFAGATPTGLSPFTSLGTAHADATQWTTGAYWPATSAAAVTGNATIVSAAWSAILVTFTPAVSQAAIHRDCFVRGIQHDIDTVAPTWLTTWTLQDANRYAGFLILGDPVYGRLGYGALAY